jgi:hypothetical protein
MMKSTLLSRNPVEYQSGSWQDSATFPGVRFRVVKMSVLRRVELTRLARDLWDEFEFHNAGSTTRDSIQAAMISAELDRVYLGWGLEAIEGLFIDGEPATVELAIAKGPEPLCREVVDAIKASCGLTEEERKN